MLGEGSVFQGDAALQIGNGEGLDKGMQLVHFLVDSPSTSKLETRVGRLFSLHDRVFGALGAIGRTLGLGTSREG